MMIFNGSGFFLLADVLTLEYCMTKFRQLPISSPHLPIFNQCSNVSGGVEAESSDELFEGV